MPEPSARRGCLVVIVIAAAISLAACSGAASGQGSVASTPPRTTAAPTTSAAPVTSVAPTTVAPTTVAPTTVAPTTAAPTTAAAPTTSAASAPGTATGAVVKVNKRFADKAIGESGTVLAYIRNFPVSAAAKKKYSLLQDDEVVLVQVKVNSSKKYYDSLGSDSFFLVGNDGQQNSENNTIVGSDMTKAGHRPLPDATNGSSTSGWIAFPVDKGFSKLTLQYYTLAANTSNGKKIPARTVNITLVK